MKKKFMGGKFSDIEGIPEEDAALYEELEGFVWYLAWKSNEQNFLMEVEELAAELTAELVKGMNYYAKLHGMPKKIVLKRMLDFRVAELNHRFYGTHRKAAKSDISLNDKSEMSEHVRSMGSGGSKAGYDGNTPEEFIEDKNTPGPEEILASMERVQMTRDRLSINGKRVFDAVILGNPKLEEIMRISAMRANHVFVNPKPTMKCWQVAEGLNLPVKVVEQAFEEIKVAYKEVCSG